MRKPILYSFRRCPYAIRTRMALSYAAIDVEHREVLLRDKPTAMLKVSPKGTVPVLELGDGQILDQSLEIMHWALGQNDPNDWRGKERQQSLQAKGEALIDENDSAFKSALDRYKYATRYPDASPLANRKLAEIFLEKLEGAFNTHPFLLGDSIALADVAIFPFVRQFAGVDRDWFDGAGFPKVFAWLRAFETGTLFLGVMQKRSPWREDGGLA